MDTTRSVDGHRQTTTLDHEISTMWKTKPRVISQETSKLLMGLEQVTGAKTLQAI
jgi:hypothetical protein